ncbi:uncharacterized protein LOC144609303 [Rhinoraja longicauda]
MAATGRILRSRVSVSTTEQETQLDDFPKARQATTGRILRSRVSVSTTEQETQLDDFPKARQATTGRILRSRVSVSTTGQETQLDDFPKARQPRNDALHCTPISRSAFKSVEQTPNQPNKCNDRTPESPLTTASRELPKKSLLQRFATSPPDVGSKDVQKPVLRKSLRLAELLNPSSTVSTDSDCQEHSGTEPEVHVDESCEPVAVKQNEKPSPKCKEEAETNKVNEEKLEMVMDEGEVSRQSPRVAVSSPVPVSVNAACNRELASEEGAAPGTDSKASFSDRAIQTVIWKIVIGAEEQLRADASETKMLPDASLRKTGAVASPKETGGTASPNKSQDAVSKGTPLIKTWNLRSKDLKSDDTLSNDKEENKADPLTTSGGDLEGKELETQTIEKAEVKEDAKVIEEVNEKVMEIAEELSRETKETHVGKHKEITKSGYHLIVSNLDSSRSFSELQVAIIRFFTWKGLSITSIGIKKSRRERA